MFKSENFFLQGFFVTFINNPKFALVIYKMTEKILALAAMEKLLKKSRAKRVSESAKIALKDFLEEKAEEIALLAVKFAAHAGRKTVKAEDIKLAAKHN